jgi:predicted ATPase
LTDGLKRFSQGLELLKQLGAVVDLPIYLDMQAKLLRFDGKRKAALAVINEALAKAVETGHAYWLAELRRTRAIITAEENVGKDAATAELQAAIMIAKEQGALALLKRAERSLHELGCAEQFEVC